MTLKPTIRIIFPSCKEKGQGSLARGVEDLASHGFKILYDELSWSPEWILPTAPKEFRLEALQAALMEPESQIILCGRGGYGASEILAGIPWRKLKTMPKKLIVGFSDIGALHSAFYAKLKWPGLHAPMPASTLWRKGGEHTDIDALMSILALRRVRHGSLNVKLLSGSAQKKISGTLFGGCLSVLCSLLGTAYFPKSLKGCILFIEDVGETAPRILRCFQQLLLSPNFKGLNGIVLGRLTELGLDSLLNEEELKAELAKRSPVPLWSSQDFGHVCPNFPLMIGAKAVIEYDSLTWTMEGKANEP